MISWMQRHKKWLIITIWVSTIAFIGAGFVGWGQYKYGDRAGAVAKVGDVEISMGEMQKTYSTLYRQYAQMFKGDFDQEKAKQFGVQKQALNQLIQRALIINLAHSYSLSVSDEELYRAIKSQKVFYKNGVFDKDLYKQVLSQNRLNANEYEKSLRKDLLIQKTLNLLKVKVSDNEKDIFNKIFEIADKIEYKVLSPKDIKVDTSDKMLKSFWEHIKDNFRTDVVYDVSYIVQNKVSKDFTVDKLMQYYKENKTHFRDKEGKIVAFEDAKKDVEVELNKKATKDQALRGYINFKKGKTDKSKIKTAKISNSQNPFNVAVLEAVSKVSANKPFLKPIEVGGIYYVFKLEKINPAKTKSFKEAKADVLPIYIKQMRARQVVAMAEESLKTFKGNKTEFLTALDQNKLTKLSKTEAGEFLQKLFMSSKKRSYIELDDGKVVLYDILEQKMLKSPSETKEADVIVKLKDAVFNEGLIKTLQSKYKTEIFIQGL